MLQLAANYGLKRLSVLDIAETIDLSASHVEGILARLRKGGLVVGFPGRRGGYQLSKGPENISIACVVAAIGGDEHREGERRTATNAALLWDGLTGEFRRFLTQVFLADCVVRAQQRAILDRAERRLPKFAYTAGGCRGR